MLQTLVINLIKIIQFLKAQRGPHSIHNIRAKTRIDLQKAENLAVKTALQNNEKVTVMGTTFQYRVSSQSILLYLIYPCTSLTIVCEYT